MRTLPFFIAVLALAACATAPPAPTSAPAPVETPHAGISEAAQRLATMLAAAGGRSAPTQSEVERAFGQPDIARLDGAGAALTYRLDQCALMLLFAADGLNVMRLAEAHASARRAGAAAPSLEQCAVEASARRT